jgi:hypothetical protein
MARTTARIRRWKNRGGTGCCEQEPGEQTQQRLPGCEPQLPPRHQDEHADDGHQRNRDRHGITTGDPGRDGGASGLGSRTYGTSASHAALRHRSYMCGHQGRSTGSAERSSPAPPAGRQRSSAEPLSVCWRTCTSTRQARPSAHPQPDHCPIGSGVREAPPPVLAVDDKETHHHHSDGETRGSDQDQGSRTSSITPSEGGCGARLALGAKLCALSCALESMHSARGSGKSLRVDFCAQSCALWRLAQ